MAAPQFPPEVIGVLRGPTRIHLCVRAYGAKEALCSRRSISGPFYDGKGNEFEPSWQTRWESTYFQCIHCAKRLKRWRQEQGDETKG